MFKIHKSVSQRTFLFQKSALYGEQFSFLVKQQGGNATGTALGMKCGPFTNFICLEQVADLLPWPDAMAPECGGRGPGFHSFSAT